MEFKEIVKRNLPREPRGRKYCSLQTPRDTVRYVGNCGNGGPETFKRESKGKLLSRLRSSQGISSGCLEVSETFKGVSENSQGASEGSTKSQGRFRGSQKDSRGSQERFRNFHGHFRGLQRVSRGFRAFKGFQGAQGGL